MKRILLVISILSLIFTKTFAQNKEYISAMENAIGLLGEFENTENNKQICRVQWLEPHELADDKGAVDYYKSGYGPHITNPENTLFANLPQVEVDNSWAMKCDLKVVYGSRLVEGGQIDAQGRAVKVKLRRITVQAIKKVKFYVARWQGGPDMLP